MKLCEGGEITSDTLTTKKRKLMKGDAAGLGLEQVAVNGKHQENGELNNNQQKIPKLKKKKKSVKESSPLEPTEQCNSDGPEEPDTPTPKKVKKKKKKSVDESETPEDTSVSEPKVNAEMNGTKTKLKTKKTAGSGTGEEGPAAKKQKMDQSQEGAELQTAQSEEKEELEDEALTLEKSEGDFSKFPISEETATNLRAKGVTYLFPIQVKTFHVVNSGKDLVVQSRTGTGKTLSFALPLIEKLKLETEPLVRGRAPRVLILTPTRELAIQIMNEIRSITKKLKVACFYGGTPYQQQLFTIKDGLDILVGTPGRVRDLIQNHSLNLRILKHVVLDEVDMMFDMGFSEQVEEILSVRYKSDPAENPQTLLFSATCPAWMYNVAKKYMQKVYEKIDLVGHRSQRAAITVEHLVIECTRHQKASILGDIIQVYSGSYGRTIVFCDSKIEAHELSTNCGSLKQTAKPLHGDLQQKEREVILKGFRQGSFEVLIATNVAARGLDIPEVDLVLLFSAPKEADSYVHRSGRTGRAGRTGVCISLCEPWERHYLRNVEHSTGIKFKHVGIPSVLNVAKSSSADAIKSLESIPADVIEHFREYAEELIEKKGAVEALAAALAQISGASSLKQRSLLSMEPGYVTVILRCSVAMNTVSYAWKAIKEQMGEDIDSKIHHMRCLKDSKGVCFDVKPEILQQMQDKWKDSRRWQFSVATELPELQLTKQDLEGPRQRQFGGRGRRPFDRRNNSRNGGRGGGSRGGGRGGGGRGGGGRGRRR
ncbi:nucleolar RNA helicase 2 [Bombina bombina]|uniref:nucleolar RNA helicase 2 n=1 Tax=Bombina bombina TaxID=8345 RepID=UPI00235AFE86|nr:nucleolar RNA helicase 2 [Bombina bombina]